MLVSAVIRRRIGSILLMIVGTVGVVISVMLISNGRADDRGVRTVYPVLVISSLAVAASLGTIAVYVISYRKLKALEPGLSDALLTYSEVKIAGRYFLFGDRMIDLHDPAVIYYNDVDALNVHEYYTRRRGMKYVLTISLMDGNIHKCIFSGGSLILNYAAENSGQLYIELRRRCPYIV